VMHTYVHDAYIHPLAALTAATYRMPTSALCAIFRMYYDMI